MEHARQSPPSPLKVLMVHNAYQQRGGEDSVVDSEMALLRDRGHQVELYRRHNDDVKDMSRARLLADTVWSRQTVQDIQALVTQHQPDVVHVHNTMPLVSPSVFWAAQGAGVPVVQTLHNYRMACLDATFLRHGQVCEDCLGKVPWRGVVHRCYRGSLAQSGAMAGMLVLHRGLGTFQRKVTRYIALSEFGRTKLAHAGLPADRISVKPNFVEWRDASAPHPREGGLFVGRLSPEKGVETLLQALDLAPATPLKVAGGGPLEEKVRERLGANCLGLQPLAQVMDLMRAASFLVLPSLWYEGFPRTIVESFACGTPVLASRLGAMGEVIEEGVTGLLFTPGDSRELADKLLWAQQNPEAMQAMGQTARQRYESRYAPDVNYQQLLSIYEQAIAEHRLARGSSQG